MRPFSAYKLAKYLPRFGWKPYVLTVDTNYLYNNDPELLKALPSDVHVTTARYIEPTLRGIRMAVGGKDRSFSKLKSQRMSGQAGAQVPTSREPGRLTKVYMRLLESWLQSPDPYWTWYGPAVRTGLSLIHRHQIPIVYTTCSPFTCHKIGRALQKQGCRWVADFRDPPTYSARMSSPNDRIYLKQRKIERETLRGADAVTVLSSAYEMIFRDMYGGLDDKRLHYIPTGVDEEFLPSDSAEKGEPNPYIIFSGEFLPEYGGLFLELFAAALDQPIMRDRGIKFLVVGEISLNQGRLGPIVERLGLGLAVEFRDHIAQRELYQLIKGAEAGVLIPGRVSSWWTCFAKMVDYLALQKPVLAVVPDPSEARTRLNRAGLGVFLDGDRETCVTKLTDFFANPSLRPRPIAEECGRYLADEQVKSFVALFEELI